MPLCAQPIATFPVRNAAKVKPTAHQGLKGRSAPALISRRHLEWTFKGPHALRRRDRGDHEPGAWNVYYPR